MGVLCDISEQITFRSNIHLLRSDYLPWFPPETPPEFWCNKVLLFCLYRPVSLYIWFVAGCMFKLYRCCSLYSVLIFLCVYTGWNGTKPVCFSEEIFRKRHKSCLAVLKAEPEQIVQRAGCSPGLGGTLASACTEGPQSLCCWGSPGMGWAVGGTNLLCSHCKGNPWLSV